MMKRLLVIFAIFFSILIVGVGGAFLGVGFWLSPQDNLQKSQAIVAISGGDTAARTQEAVRLYKAGWAPKIIFSGAALDPNSPSNARAMQTIAVSEGVPRVDILLDETSENTQQNAADVAFIVRSQNFNKVILVTSPYHQRRAYLTFSAALGKQVTIINHSTTDQEWRRAHWWATPNSRALTSTELKKTLYVIWGGHLPN